MVPSEENNVTMRSIFIPLLSILFIALKLCKVIAWSWLWVLSPLWIPAVIAVLIFIAVIAIGR